MPTTARSPLLLALLCAPLAACLGGALPGPGPDPGSDGGVGAPDLAPASCGALAAEVAQWIAAHQSCQTDADCTVVTTACGLPDGCATFANQTAAGATLDGLVGAWEQQCGATIDCACPDFFPAPGCNDGVCGPRVSPTPPTSTGQVGDPCATDGDCLGGTCLGPQQGFPNGYCTLGCDANGSACPTGSRCQDPGIGVGGAVCLRACDATLGPGGCRPDGYACCSGPGPATPSNGQCVPNSSMLCGEL